MSLTDALVDFKAAPKCDAALRQLLLTYFVTNYDSGELSEWLDGLGEDSRGTIEEKQRRVLEHTPYLDTPWREFPDETERHLSAFPSDYLEEICELLGLDPDGSKGVRYRRIMREVGYREGWLPGMDLVSEAGCVIHKVLPFVRWHRVLKRWDYERDFYPDFQADLEESFGEKFVHPQRSVGSGLGLKIDFHIGHPQRAGVGVEFKMPTNMSEIQRAIGQIDQYQQHYGDQLIVVLIPDFLDSAKRIAFNQELERRGIRVLEK